MQVLGVVVLTATDRKIQLGCDAKSTGGPFAMLVQDRPNWINPALESGFRFDFGSTSTDVLDLRIRQQPCSNSRQPAHPNTAPSNKHMFSMCWTRLLGPTRGSAAESVAGQLLCCFPAVILRTRNPTTTAKEIFETKYRQHLPVAHIAHEVRL